MEDIKYAYQIHPKKSIRALPEFGLIRTKRTLMLTKEQVKKVLPFASVYRRFNHDTVERVDRKSTRLNSSHIATSRMPSSA